MRVISMVCAAGLLIAAPAAVQSQPTQAASPTRLVDPALAMRGFDAAVEQAMKEWQVPGVAISVVKDGKVILSKGYGVRDPITGAPMTKDTLIEIASTAKSFTAFGAGLLVDQQAIDLDEPVSTYVPRFRVDDVLGTSQISLRDLLSHRSGLKDVDFLGFYNPGLERPELIERLRHFELSSPIRTEFEYSNFGYSVVGHALERTAGNSWEEFTQQRILGALGMTRSTTLREHAMKDPNHIRGVVWWKGRYVPTEMSVLSKAAAPHAQIYSTADDLSKWMLVNLSGGKIGGKQIIKAETLQELHKTAVPVSFETDPDVVEVGYGLGWFTQFYRGEPLLTHGGNDWGISTDLAILPRVGLGVAVLANQDSSLFPTALMRTVIDRFIGANRDWSGQMLEHHRERLQNKDGLPARQAKERALGTVPSRPLSAYVGTYSHPAMGPVTVRLEGDRLIVEGSGEKAPLIHWQYDVFAAASSNHLGMWTAQGWMTRASFVTDTKGQISELRLSNAPGYAFKREGS